MSGPFTTITAERWYRLQDVLMAARRYLEVALTETPSEQCATPLYALRNAVRKAMEPPEQ